MALAYRTGSFVSAGNGSGGDLTLTKPTGTVDGDLVVIGVYCEPDTISISITTGTWETLEIANTGAFKIKYFWKIAASEPASYTISHSPSGSQWRGAVGAAYSGATGSGTRLDVSATNQGDGVNGSSLNAPSVTTTGTDRLLVFGFGDFGGTNPTSTTGAANNLRGALGGLTLADALRATAGATGTTVANGLGTETFAALHVALISDLAGGGSAVAGTAALSGSGTIAPVAQVAVAGVASIPASGTLAAVATNSVPGAAVLSATGTVAASATNSVPAQAALLASGTLAPVGRVAVAGVAALQGAGGVAAAGTVSGSGAQVAGSAALSATGTLAPVGRVAVAGIAALAGTGTIAPLGRVAVAGVAALAGTGTLAATGQRAVTGVAALAGAGTVAAVGQRTVGASASLGASASVTAVGRLVLAAAALLAATGSLTATGSGGTIVIGQRHLEAVVVLAGGLVAAVGAHPALAPAIAPRWTEQQPAVGGYGVLTPSVAGG